MTRHPPRWQGWVVATLPRHHLADFSPTAAVADFERQGCLQLDGFAAPELIQRLADRFAQDYVPDLKKRAAVDVGKGRHMLPVDVRDEFNDPAIYAEPRVLDLMKRLLGEEIVIGLYTCVAAMPGAEAQHKHRDYVGLFPNSLEFQTASYGLNLIVPLLPLGREIGTTRMWPGTHRNPVSEKGVTREQSVLPETELGTVLLMDYRLIHRGTPNHSPDRIRPVLFLGYQRPWFFDNKNFKGLAPLQISEEALERVSEQHRGLFMRRGVLG